MLLCVFISPNQRKEPKLFVEENEPIESNDNNNGLIQWSILNSLLESIESPCRSSSILYLSHLQSYSQSIEFFTLTRHFISSLSLSMTFIYFILFFCLSVSLLVYHRLFYIFFHCQKIIRKFNGCECHHDVEKCAMYACERQNRAENPPQMQAMSERAHTHTHGRANEREKLHDANKMSKWINQIPLIKMTEIDGIWRMAV